MNSSGNWVTAKIYSVNSDNTYDLRYEDGFEDRGVEISRIRRFSGEGYGGNSLRSYGNFNEGDRVEARYQGTGKFYPGRVTRVYGDGTYEVTFDYGESSTLSKDSVRPYSQGFGGRGYGGFSDNNYGYANGGMSSGSGGYGMQRYGYGNFGNNRNFGNFGYGNDNFDGFGYGRYGGYSESGFGNNFGNNRGFYGNNFGNNRDFYGYGNRSYGGDSYGGGAMQPYGG